MKEGLDNKKFQQITTKYNSNHRKHRYELVGQHQLINVEQD